jgi:hypothetical protein
MRPAIGIGPVAERTGLRELNPAALDSGGRRWLAGLLSPQRDPASHGKKQSISQHQLNDKPWMPGLD